MAAVVAALCAACGGSTSSPGGGTPTANPISCTLTASESACVETSKNGLSAADISAIQTACTDGTTPGTFANAACPTANVIGTCAFTSSPGTNVPSTIRAGIVLKSLYYSPRTVASAQGDCTSNGGTFTAASTGGTGGTGGTTTIASCNFSADSSCADLTGTLSATALSAVQTACVNDGGTYSTAACPTANRVGRCTWTSDGTNPPGVPAGIGITTSAYSPITTAAAQAECSTIPGGTFAAN
jgi:hypothetical protein